MVTFKQYLEENEEEPTNIIKPWSIEKRGANINVAMSLLDKHAKNGWLKAIQNGGVIYRGFGDKFKKSNFLIIDSSTGERTSKDSNNLYQLMLSTSTEMKEYADRSKSFICSTKVETAGHYGYPAYVMVPFDDTILTVSEVSDFFKQIIVSPIFTGKVNQMNEISAFLTSVGVKKSNNNKFMNAAEIDNQLEKLPPEKLMFLWDVFITQKSLKFTNEKFQKIYDKIELIDFLVLPKKTERIKEIKMLESEINAGRFTISSESLKRVYELFKSEKNKRFTALASEIMTPESTKLSLVKYGDPLKKNVECWFSGKSIIISLSLFKKILLKLEEQGFPIHDSLRIFTIK
jgi:hypothetical protein